MSKKATGIGAIVVALAVGGAGLSWLRPVQAQGGWEPPPTPVALAAVVHTHAPRVLHAVGELEAVRQVQLASEVAGRISRINFVSGQTVKAGQVLVQLNDATEQAERARLVAQLGNAEKTLKRTQTLQTSRAMTEEQLDNATAARDMAKSELQRIEAIIAQKAIRAPFDGMMGIARVHLLIQSEINQQINLRYFGMSREELGFGGMGFVKALQIFRGFFDVQLLPIFPIRRP